jgi:hypothetical protein
LKRMKDLDAVFLHQIPADRDPASRHDKEGWPVSRMFFSLFSVIPLVSPWEYICKARLEPLTGHIEGGREIGPEATEGKSRCSGIIERIEEVDS